MTSIVNPDVIVTIEQISSELAFVFVGSEYAGSAEKGALDVWSAYPVLRLPLYDGEMHADMMSAVGDVVNVHAFASLKEALAL